MNEGQSGASPEAAALRVPRGWALAGMRGPHLGQPGQTAGPRTALPDGSGARPVVQGHRHGPVEGPTGSSCGWNPWESRPLAGQAEPRSTRGNCRGPAAGGPWGRRPGLEGQACLRPAPLAAGRARGCSGQRRADCALPADGAAHVRVPGQRQRLPAHCAQRLPLQRRPAGRVRPTPAGRAGGLGSPGGAGRQRPPAGAGPPEPPTLAATVQPGDGHHSSLGRGHANLQSQNQEGLQGPSCMGEGPWGAATLGATPAGVSAPRSTCFSPGCGPGPLLASGRSPAAPPLPSERSRGLPGGLAEGQAGLPAGCWRRTASAGLRSQGGASSAARLVSSSLPTAPSPAGAPRPRLPPPAMPLARRDQRT